MISISYHYLSSTINYFTSNVIEHTTILQNWGGRKYSGPRNFHPNMSNI